MIKCNLSKILGEKRIKVSSVVNDLGFHRHTVDQLYHDRALRFEKDVLNTLCNYLNVSINELLEFIPDNPKQS